MIVYPKWHDSYPEQKQEEHSIDKIDKLSKTIKSITINKIKQDLPKFDGPPWAQYKKAYNMALAEAIKINNIEAQETYGPLFNSYFSNNSKNTKDLNSIKAAYTLLIDGETDNPFQDASDYADECLTELLEKDPSASSVTIQVITNTQNVKPYYSILSKHAVDFPSQNISILCKDLGLSSIDSCLIEELVVKPGPLNSTIQMSKYTPF